MKMQATVTFECGTKYCFPCELWTCGATDSYCSIYRIKEGVHKGFRAVIAHMADKNKRCPECLADAVKEVKE